MAHKLAPRHPVTGNPSFIACPGYRGAPEVRAFDRQAVGSIAKPLHQVARDPKVVEEALKRGLGAALLGQAWLNQLPKGDSRLPNGFSALPYFYERGELDPNTRWTSKFIDDYAARYVDAQAGAGGTLLTSPAHVLGHEGPGPGRDNELRLIRACVDEFSSRGAAFPGLDRGERVIFATLAVKGNDLYDSAMWLIDAYADLPVDGIWLTIAGFTSSRRQLLGAARLALGLEHRTGRPVVVSGVGLAHLAFLAAGLSATSVGHHALHLKYPPVAVPSSEQREGGLGTHVYHPKILGNVRLGDKGDSTRRRLFLRWQCSCGSHRPATPPSTQTDIRAHNMCCATGEVLELKDLSSGAARERWMLDRISAADEARQRLEVNSRVGHWASVVRVAQDLRSGKGIAAAGE